jgi:hypothetical protein
MTRATRLLALTIPLTILWLLAIIHILPIPFIAQNTADEILPTVSPPSVSSTRGTHCHKLINLPFSPPLDTLVVHRRVRSLLSRVLGIGTGQI